MVLHSFTSSFAKGIIKYSSIIREMFAIVQRGLGEGELGIVS